MSESIRSNMSIALAIILSLIYVGYCYGTFCSIAPAHWFIATDPLKWAAQTVGLALAGLQFLMFFVMPPFCLVLLALSACAIRFAPRNFCRRHLSLLLPLVPTLSIPIWAAYVCCHRSVCHEWGAFQNSWEMKVLNTLTYEMLIPFVAGGLFILCSARWKGERIFGLSIMTLESAVVFSESMAASWPISNVWL